MSTTIKLSDALITDAKTYSQAFSRSVPKQIEYWAKIGKIAEENPDLPYNTIKELLLAEKEIKNGDVMDYKFS